MENFTKTSEPPGIVVIGGNSSFNYLIQRYAERIGCSISVVLSSASVEAISQLKPVAIVFPSVENLGDCQLLVTGLTNCDIPIIVCSSIEDQNHARALGADYCLVHPLIYDQFSIVLEAIRVQGIRQSEDVAGEV